jgi:hypothetical protein
VTGGVNDGDIVLGGLELPEGDIDGDTTLTLGLELVKNPRILEGTLAELSGFLCLVSARSLAIECQMRRAVGGVEMRGEWACQKKIPLSARFVCPSPALRRGAATKAEEAREKVQDR